MRIFRVASEYLNTRISHYSIQIISDKREGRPSTSIIRDYITTNNKTITTVRFSHHLLCFHRCFSIFEAKFNGGSLLHS